ncbi:MAG: hypothetical protein HDT23_03350 [Ruminococcus sp.]|nr:hypothetical protein [Ruminococcus sp.]
MNKLKVMSYIYIILLPYLVMMSIYFVLLKSVTLSLVCIILLCIAGIFACISGNVSALADENDIRPAIMNIVTKICYIPVYVICRYFFLGMLNPFLMVVSVIPFAIGICTVCFSGFCNIGVCINLFRKGKCKLFVSVILCLMGFVYVLDIIGAVIQIILCRKKGN